MDRAELEGLDRESLVVKAQEAGIRRARILTRPELIDELLRLDPKADRAAIERSRGFFGVARDLLARVVERGLHLPDAADRIREIGGLPGPVPRAEPQAVPTVTLAEIYAAQGHPRRAVETLEKVLEREPDHAAARALLARLSDAEYVAPPPPLPPEPEVEEAAAPPADEEASEEEGDHDIDALESAPTNELAGMFGSVADDADTIALAGPLAEDAVTIAIPGLMAPGDSAAVTNVLTPECVVLPTGPRSAFVWWRAGLLREGSPFVVRVLVVTPSWDGPRSEARDVEIDPSTSELALEDLPERAVVRAAIGWGAGEAFSPIAHAPLLEAAPRAVAGPVGLLRWTLEGMRPVALGEPGARAILDALRRVRSFASPGQG